jgi:hypothetical protein
MDRTARKTKRVERRGREPLARPDAEIIEAGGLRIERRNIILAAIALAAIGGGFATLAMGSTTVSAVLLVGGYLGLVPWAILAGHRDRAGSCGSADAGGDA